MIAPRLPNQYRLAERRSFFEECFALCDEQVGDWPNDARLGAGVVEIRRRVNALPPGFILTGACQKLWADPGMRTAWRTLRFGWRGAIFGQSGLFVYDGPNPLCGWRFLCGLGSVNS